MKVGFGHAQPPSRGSHEGKRPGWKKYSVGLAASIAMLALSFGAGILGYQAGKQLDSDHSGVIASATSEQSHRVMLQISESNPAHFTRALDYAKNYIREHEARGGEVAPPVMSRNTRRVRSAHIYRIRETHSSVWIFLQGLGVRPTRAS